MLLGHKTWSIGSEFTDGGTESRTKDKYEQNQDMVGGRNRIGCDLRIILVKTD